MSDLGTCMGVSGVGDVISDAAIFVGLVILAWVRGDALGGS